MDTTAELKRLTRLDSRTVKHWTPTLIIFSVSAVVAALYVSDWKVTNTKLPYCGRKIDDEGNL